MTALKCSTKEDVVPPGITNRVLVTGARGRVARAVAGLLSSKYQLVLTDLPSSSGEETAEGYLPADLMDFAQVVPLMEGVDMVVHLAVVAGVLYEDRAEPGPLEVDSFEEAVLRINPMTTYHVFEAARRAGVRRIIYGSSLTIQLGDLNTPHFSESGPAEPQSVYACSKLLGENLARLYHRLHGMETLSLRIGQPFPLVPRLDLGWRHNFRARSVSVAVEDIAGAIAAAISSPIPHGVFNVVSESDNPRVDLEGARKMGYQPRYKFSGDGLSQREDGNGDWHLVSPTSSLKSNE